VDNNRFLHARDGDMLSCPFQCDFCWFVNVNARQVNLKSVSDERLMGYIRRVNLDLMWSREGWTVAGTLSAARKAKRMSEELNMKPQNILMGPWPVKDHQGFQTAIEMLRASQKPGRNTVDYVQFDTIRKVRTVYSTIHDNSARGGADVACFKGNHGKPFH